MTDDILLCIADDVPPKRPLMPSVPAVLLMEGTDRYIADGPDLFLSCVPWLGPGSHLPKGSPSAKVLGSMLYPGHIAQTNANSD